MLAANRDSITNLASLAAERTVDHEARPVGGRHVGWRRDDTSVNGGALVKLCLSTSGDDD
jgi:hypothetical protein